MMMTPEKVANQVPEKIDMISFHQYSLLSNQFFLLFFSVGLGLVIGKVKIKGVSLGSSAILFISLFLSWLIKSFFVERSNGFPELAEVVNANSSLVSGEFFSFSLALFISSVGLLAGPSLGYILKKYGYMFPFMAVVVTSSGFLVSLIFRSLFDIEPYLVTGLFSGALTSSPGLAVALENASSTSQESAVGLGYALGYIPGLLAVVTSMHWLPKLLKIDIKSERQAMSQVFTRTPKNSKERAGFNFMSYSLVIICGVFLSNFSISIGFLQSLTIGLTGGILMSSLFFGHLRKFWIFNFEMDPKLLKFIQEMGLVMFLASIGLRNGYTVLSDFSLTSGLILLASFVVALFSISVALWVGKVVFKMNWIVLSGAICGGMTSTPGLAAAIDSLDTESVAASYGAVYPFALVCMVFLVLLSL